MTWIHPHLSLIDRGTGESGTALILGFLSLYIWSRHLISEQNMNGLDEVPFKVPLGLLEGPLEEIVLVSASELTIPDHLQILQETEYKFNLENWVLTGFHDGKSSQITNTSLTVRPTPSCPPYWLMFSSPQESRLASRRSSDLWQPLPRRRSQSLSAADGYFPHPRVKLLMSNLEGEGGYSEDDESSSSEEDSELRCARVPKHQNRGLKVLRRCSSPHLSRTASPCHSVRQNKASPLTLQDFKHLSLSNREKFRVDSPPVVSQKHSKRKLRPLGQISRRHCLTPQPPCSSPTSRPPPRPSTAEHIPSIKSHKPTVPSLSRYSCLPTPPSVTQSLGSQSANPDSSMELLSVLSEDERDLLQAITEQGYPLRTAIAALQRTGRQTPDQILSYLLACDRLCRLGYDKTEVEEALEMFQNCETKAAEFLRLLTLFNEMGFQQNTIKEVLLVHGNHRERALEELMTRVA
ncbi:ubiquitin-associated protein 1-like [Arapaima gigas]